MDESALGAGLAQARARSFGRGAQLLRAGDRARDVLIVIEGLLREYYVLPDGAERTKSFVVEHQAAGSLPDLISGEPSRAYIVAEATTRVLVFEFAALRALQEPHPSWARLEMEMTRRLLLTKTEREYELLGLDAEARYDVFRSRFPGVEERVAARHVASYVGITPVHLSRLRRTRRARASR
ncbi:MAG: Crp/Fnr family transcriptional regulator [Nannocystales bacterium]